MDIGLGAALLHIAVCVRVPHIGQAASLAGKVILCNPYVSSLLKYKAQFAEDSRDVLQT